MIAKVEFVKGTVTGEQYAVLRVYTGRQSMGRDYITLKLSCTEYQGDKEERLADLTQIAKVITESQVRE